MADPVGPDNTPESAEYAAGKRSAHKAPRVGRLDSLPRVRAELGKLYRAARRREGVNPDALTASRLAAILGAIARSIETAELEARIAALEAMTESEARR